MTRARAGATLALSSILSATLIGGCSRSVLSVAAPVPDGAVADASQERDATTPAFGCRWSIGARSEVRSLPGPPVTLSAAVDARADRVGIFVTITGGGDALLQGRAFATSPSTVFSMITANLGTGQVLTLRDGFGRVLATPERDCGVTLHSDVLLPEETFRPGVVNRCFADQTVPFALDFLDLPDDGPARVVRVRWDGAPEATSLGELDEALLAGGAVVDLGDEDLRVAALTPAFELILYELRAGTARRIETGLSNVTNLSAAPNRSRESALLLLQEDGAWTLAEARGPDLALGTVVDIAALGIAPVGRVVSTDAEALVPLADGRMLVVNLGSLEARVVLEAAPGGGSITFADVVVRTGTSIGGILDLSVAGGVGWTVGWRTLRCGR
ncbi:MAG: hypothetical protein ACFCGT_18810 [Sandaracinaceae bacterium]